MTRRLVAPDLDAVVALVEQVAREALVAVEDVREKAPVR